MKRIEKHAARTSLAALAVFIFAFVILSPSAAGGQAPPPGTLDSHLGELLDAASANDPGTVERAAQALGVAAGDGDVRVVVEARDGLASVAAENVAGIPGAVVETQYEDLVQVRVPPEALDDLASARGVGEVRVPLRAVPLVTSQGVALTNADDWQAQGITGAGVRVAILDLGFSGYQAKLGTELPASVTTMSFRADGDITGGGQPHGAGVAEVVHDMAPSAQLYLVNFDTEVELGAATTWLAGQDIDIINASWGYFASGPGDGTGIVDGIVSDSVATGTFWSVAAGNHAQRHWSGTFTDTDNDTFHEFTTGATPDEGNEIIGPFLGLVLAGQTVSSELKWDDPFGAACRDYELYLMRTQTTPEGGEVLVTVASSENLQHNAGGCVPGADPTEGFTVAVPVTDTYHLVVKEKFSTVDAFIELFSWAHDLEYRVTPGTLLQPGDNASVTTVGAVPQTAPGSIENFSSRGPTRDGRTKPDITAPDGVSNSVYSSFSGTSAASPHVAGAAALAKQRLQCLSSAQLGALLESNVVDLGTPGKDNTFGSGRLSLGTPPADTDGDGNGDACDPDADGDGLLDSIETTCGVTGPGASIRPERTDGPFAGVSDDGDLQIDEPLPPAAQTLDCDGDGFTGTDEDSVFFPATGRDQDACGTDGWPANPFDAPPPPPEVVNRLDLQDIISFLGPVRHFDTSPGNPAYDARWDLMPGPGGFLSYINLQDITALLAGPTGHPPMLNETRAFGQTCPWAP